MLYWASIFLIIGIIDEILGLAGVAGAATYFKYALFVVFVVIAIISFIVRRRPPAGSQEVTGSLHRNIIEMDVSTRH